MSNNLDTTVRVKLMGDGKMANNELDVGIKESEKSGKNRLILALSIMCIILAIGLIFCFVRYKICDSNAAINSSLSSKKSPCPKTTQSRLQTSVDILNDEYLVANWNDSRLPSSLKPYLYEINLRINVDDKFFNGTTSIKFKCFRPIAFAVVHSDPNLVYDFSGVKIYNLLYNGQLGQSLQIKNVSYNAFYSYFIFHLDNGQKFLENQNYEIVFENYNSTITNNLKGIYYSTYVTNNVTK